MEINLLTNNFTIKKNIFFYFLHINHISTDLKLIYLFPLKKSGFKELITCGNEKEMAYMVGLWSNW